MVQFIAESRKALLAGLAAGIAAYTSGTAAGQKGQALWAYVVGSALVAGVLVYFLPNKAAATK